MSNYGPAMTAYLKFAALKPRGDSENTINTMAKPKPGFMEQGSGTAGMNGASSKVETPYASTPAFPWENPEMAI